MKKTLLLSLFLASMLSAFSQSTTLILNSNQAQINRGGYQVDSNLVVPVRDTTLIYPNLRNLGTIQIRRTDNKLYYYNGSRWVNPSDFVNIDNKPMFFPTNIANVQGLSAFNSNIQSQIDNRMVIGSAISYTQITGFNWPNLAEKPTAFPSTIGLIPSLSFKLDSVATAISGKQPAGSYLTSITGQQVRDAVGFDPYPASNPNGYITASQVPAAPVPSVNGRVGAITLTSSDVNLGNVNNTSDANKPISTATQTALNGKQNAITLTTTGTGAATLTGSTLNIPIPASPAGYAISTTNVGLTRSQLNTTYSGTAPEFRVYCPDITLGGAIYIRITSGATGRWQTISAPPTL